MLLNCGAEEDSWESLGLKDDQTSQSWRKSTWILIGRTDEAEVTLWPPDTKSWLIGKDTDAGEDWRQKEKDVAEDEMVRQYHQLSGQEFEQTPGDSEG